MTKLKLGKFLVISFIALIITFFVGFGENLALKAGSPAAVSKTEIDFDKRIQLLESDLASGKITKHEYDSLSDLIRSNKEHREAIMGETHSPDKIPSWVTKLGISEPSGMKFDQVFSNSTSVSDPTEGFNSVSLVYTGNYETAMAEAARIASEANLKVGGVFKAKGSPVKSQAEIANPGISYLNYSLGKTDKDFLVSLQVEPSGRLIIMVTDNKQLNEMLLAYAPLNNRQNSAAKQKKQ
jgi:hypothetical protein